MIDIEKHGFYGTYRQYGIHFTNQWRLAANSGHNIMIPLNTLVQKLDYDVSPYYCRVNAPHPPESAHLFRSAKALGVDGIYVFQRAPKSLQGHYTPAPAVYVAEAGDENEARQIHRKLWNLCFAPFAIIRLPNQIRVYTGFNYWEEKDREGLLDEITNLQELNRLLKELNATAIDTGMVWQSQYAKKLDSSQRVDRRLLKNIRQLGDALIRDGGLEDELANRLIGKYVYLKYLRDRGILTDQWMHKNNIAPEKVFSLDATVTELEKLVDELEDRFNGKTFPINFKEEETLKDTHVKWVAAIFSGAVILDRETTPAIVMQLALPFKAYDFEYIPVETLSTIYEQFIFDRKSKGAVYTPEALADYVIAEMDSVKPLQRGMKILDPACGSGIFLVLIYRLLIEREMKRRGEKLNAEELLDIMGESIYGVEREPDACYVAEFSLILTLLHYLDPRDLQNINFRFPSLHNQQVFECDFFDIEGKESSAGFWQKKLSFDWIIGNPPWRMLKRVTGKEENAFAYHWMNRPGNKKSYPVGDNQIAEAFSWLVTDLLEESGITGLILPATSLFNIKARHYRKRFFSEHEVLKVTNYANLRETIWGKRENKENKNKPTLPPAILIYRPAEKGREKKRITHYSPFEINQLIETKDKPWVMTINETEIKTLSPYEAETGDTSFWKQALWGTYIDKRVIERIKHTFPNTLKAFCDEKKWAFYEGPQFRCNDKKLKHLDTIKGKKQFNTLSMRESLYRYSIPSKVLTSIPEECCYIRRGEKTGLKLTTAPHIIMSSSWMSFVIYSDLDFVIPPRQIGISAPGKNHQSAETIKALSLYLNSHLVAYILFFHAPEWGVFRHARKVTVKDVREIPTPAFTADQITQLAQLQDELVTMEKEKISKLISAQKKPSLFAHHIPDNEDNDNTRLPEDLTPAEKKNRDHDIARIRKELQARIDQNIYEILGIPQDIRTVIDDFFNFRLPLDTPSQKGVATRKPTAKELAKYAGELKYSLDDFLGGEAFVRVNIIQSDDLIELIVEVVNEGDPFPLDDSCVKQGNTTRASLLKELSGNLRRQVSQWVYVQRGLRLFDGPRIHLYKTPRIIDWTGTQAIIDAGDITGALIPTHDD
jgi:Eco57I restriction-modification methylase